MSMAQKTPTTHQFVDVEKIEEGIVELKNKNLRAILMVSSLNFDLKSSDEREALVAGFQQFLNSLDFPLEIVVQSRPLDLTEYFGFLREHQEKQENELLRIQIAEYLDFIRELVQLSSIMSKFFYVVVPYDVAIVKKSGLLQGLLKRGGVEKEQAEKTRQEAKNELLIRVNQVYALLGQMSLRAIMLSDRELVELFYGLYNPGVALKQKNFEALLETGEGAKEVA